MASIAAKPRREAANRGSRAVGADRAQIADVDPGAVVRPRAKELLEGNNQNKCEMLTTKMVPTARKIMSGALVTIRANMGTSPVPHPTTLMSYSERRIMSTRARLPAALVRRSFAQLVLSVWRRVMAR